MKSAKRVRGFTGRDIAVDLGTANTLVYVRGRGIVLDEPSVVAIDVTDGTPLAVGHQAKRMAGRTPAHIQVIRPLKYGVSADFDVCEKMLRYFITKYSSRWAKPRMVMCAFRYHRCRTTSGASSQYAGARKPAFIIEEPMAGHGAGLPIQSPHGSMIVDIGGGTPKLRLFLLAAWLRASQARRWRRSRWRWPNT